MSASGQTLKNDITGRLVSRSYRQVAANASVPCSHPVESAVTYRYTSVWAPPDVVPAALTVQLGSTAPAFGPEAMAHAAALMTWAGLMLAVPQTGDSTSVYTEVWSWWAML